MSKELYANAALHRFVRYKAREEILASVGDISGVEVFGTQILVAPYVHCGILMRPGDHIQANEILSREALYDLYESRKGLITQSLAIESIWQGKVCLVLKVGSAILAGEKRRQAVLARLDAIEQEMADLDRMPSPPLPMDATRQEWDENEAHFGRERDKMRAGLMEERDELSGDVPGPLEFSVGDWIWTLQENTRGISICAPGATQSRVLKRLGVDYVGWPCKLLYAADVYGRLDDPNILA